ncbi:retrotransposon protein putative ty3-gypsy sub-class [Cucumis melo var. makuwa]|uniref:Retrotransposon protein putative ty3-gypsy sub-class n=1 Tax=Cucumis melo var. makuwa TaxID=1194695 RepID=A0A5D3CBM3_CUCMM|nr:retrotransposon protein putative ty3-gypsy sub-class [Cucumis melo var. makuwa]TYK08702.1 retrotransposon protein putative ty3-gypsy sub-class [Cucumis melo var. makuwa]
MIANSIRAQYRGPPQTSFISKSYTKRIINLRIPLGWEQLEKEFLSHFYSTRCTVSMMELTNMKQRKGEPVTDYINRLKALRIEPCTFEELATRAHDMMLSITNRGAKDFPIPEVRKDKKEMKGAQKIVKSNVKESMVVNTTLLKFSKRKEVSAKKKDDELILRLAHEKKIELDLEEVAKTNHAAVTIMSEAPLSRLIFEQRENLDQFGTFKPIVV